MQSREVHLVRRPDGMPRPSDFEIREVALSEPADGQVLVKNVYLSIDPATRPRLTRGQELNVVMGGFALGRVVKSRTPNLKEGDIVRGAFGYREAYVTDARYVGRVDIDPKLPLAIYMSVMGGAGFVAYGGLLEIGKMKSGEQVFVSTAAGSVGSLAAQIARLKGCTVIGSTGSDDKVAWLQSLGLDAVINYKKEPIREALDKAAPKGIDVYFDNVGGDHLEAALRKMNSLGRIAVCGMISTYNDQQIGVRNLSLIIYGRINIRGFVTTDFPHLLPQFNEEMTGWLRDGKIKYQETYFDGIDNAPAALIGMLNGENTGKTLVRLG
ncbi:MAG: NADP-dependent oxidoreductase [Alphaproteobacteria bacterium]|nr:NADP-dependent oxidoreductase [Alphaproteobacteria bacterium]MBL7099751.1 NADP-dependent oxidoreductase [Alphaproteobacteria bacterium]